MLQLIFQLTVNQRMKIPNKSIDLFQKKLYSLARGLFPNNITCIIHFVSDFKWMIGKKRNSRQRHYR